MIKWQCIIYRRFTFVHIWWQPYFNPINEFIFFTSNKCDFFFHNFIEQLWVIFLPPNKLSRARLPYSSLAFRGVSNATDHPLNSRINRGHSRALRGAFKNFCKYVSVAYLQLSLDEKSSLHTPSPLPPSHHRVPFGTSSNSELIFCPQISRAGHHLPYLGLTFRAVSVAIIHLTLKSIESF